MDFALCFELLNLLLLGILVGQTYNTRVSSQHDGVQYGPWKADESPCELDAGFTGDVYKPDDADYASASEVLNTVIGNHPRIVVVPKTIGMCMPKIQTKPTA